MSRIRIIILCYTLVNRYTIIYNIKGISQIDWNDRCPPGGFLFPKFAEKFLWPQHALPLQFLLQ